MTGLRDCLEAMEIDFLIFDRPPEPLDKDVIEDRATAVHTDWTYLTESTRFFQIYSTGIRDQSRDWGNTKKGPKIDFFKKWYIPRSLINGRE